MSSGRLCLGDAIERAGERRFGAVGAGVGREGGILQATQGDPVEGDAQVGDQLGGHVAVRFEVRAQLCDGARAQLI